MPKISELNAITGSQVLSTDLIAIAHDVNGLPSTKKITVSDFSNAISAAVTTNYTYANTISAGVVKVGNYLSVNATGYINAQQSVLPTANLQEGFVLTWDDALNEAVWQGFSGVVDYILLNSANTYTAERHQNVLFVDPNNISQDVTIILPDSSSVNSPVQGKQYTVKNINPGAGYKVTVTTQSGIDSNSNYIENPVTGEMVVEYDLIGKGSGDTWIYNGTVWRHIFTQRAVPTFYTSVDTYAQLAVKNASASNNASTDLVLYNNLADIDGEGGPYIDIGINSSTYNNPLYDVTGPNDGYIYTRAANLAIGTSNTGKAIILHAGGTTANDSKMVINTTAVSVNTSTAFILPLSTKANNSVGTAGQISWDSNNIYVCVGTNSWKKASLVDF